MPALLLFLGLGMLAGSEGVGGIYFDDAVLSQRLGIVALAFILFAGGLETDWQFVRSGVRPAGALATVGVLVTSIVVGYVAHLLTDLTLLEGMLLGAIVSSTDAAAVFSILRSRGVRIRRDVAAVLELESGSNDPMAVFLTTAVLQLIQGSSVSAGHFVFDFVRQMVFGAAAGVAVAFCSGRLLNRLRLEYQGLYPVMTIALVLFTYGATALIGGNGFLAVYVAAIVMANRNFVQRRTLTRFHDGVAWLMQIAMFVTLGLLVFPSQLLPVATVSMVLAAVLILAARPIAVYVSLAAARFSFAEKSLIAWVGLRGAVPIVLATFPLVAGLPAAPTIFNIVFFVVLTSVLVQGTTIPLAARALRVEASTVQDRSPTEAHLAGRGESAIVTLEVEPGAVSAGRSIVELDWPRESLILVIYRGNEFFVPNGASVLEPGDRLIVLTTRHSIEELQRSVAQSAA